MEADLARLEADLQALGQAYAKIGADLAEISADLEILLKRVARLPSNKLWIAMMTIEVAVLSPIILFADELRALIGP